MLRRDFLKYLGIGSGALSVGAIASVVSDKALAAIAETLPDAPNIPLFEGVYDHLIVDKDRHRTFELDLTGGKGQLKYVLNRDVNFEQFDASNHLGTPIVGDWTADYSLSVDFPEQTELYKALDRVQHGGRFDLSVKYGDDQYITLAGCSWKNVFCNQGPGYTGRHNMFVNGVADVKDARWETKS